jgi:hypothetical protein
MLNIAKKLSGHKTCECQECKSVARSLYEAKADTQKLIDFAGEALAKRFELVKKRAKPPKNDLYFWIKNKSVEELEEFVSELEETPSKTKAQKDIADEGAELVQETEHWKVYRIDTFEASKKYGRDSKWCITGVGPYGDNYWNKYKKQGYTFYFIITKGKYNPRGDDSKFAVAAFPGDKPEIYDQTDVLVHYSAIPFADEIDIPGVNLKNAEGEVWYCEGCAAALNSEEFYLSPDGEVYCEECFFQEYFLCDNCSEAFALDSAVNSETGQMYCPECAGELGLYASSAVDMENEWPELLDDGTYDMVGSQLDRLEKPKVVDGAVSCKHCGRQISALDGYNNIWGDNIGYACCNEKYLDGEFEYPLKSEVGDAEYFIVLVRDGFYEFEDNIPEMKKIIKAWIKAKNTGKLKFSDKLIQEIEESAQYQLIQNNYLTVEEVEQLFR